MVHSAIPLPGLSYDLVDVIVMNANGCTDFETCGVAGGQDNDDNLFWVKDNAGPSPSIDAQTMVFKIIFFLTKMRIIKTVFKSFSIKNQS